MNHLLESLLKEDKSREFDSLFQPAPLGALERRFIEYLKSLGCVENAEGLWDYSGNLDMSNMRLTKFPVRFGQIKGYFYCANNKLTTLEGAPKEVGGYFYCFLNLVSVENLKKTVQRDYLMKEMLKRIQESKDVQQ